jgi:hypothetical protein
MRNTIIAMLLALLVVIFVIGCEIEPTPTASPLPTVSPLPTPPTSPLVVTSAVEQLEEKGEIEMDFESVQIGGITLVFLILGMVEGAKEFGVNGKGSLLMSILLGAVLFGMSRANELGLVPATVMPYAEVVIYGLGGGLSVAGLYRLGKRAGLIKSLPK